MNKKENMKIEICLAVYQRRERLPELIDQLKEQTNQNFNLNIWNNSGKQLNTNGFPKDRLKIIDSIVNIGSIARFKLVPLTKGKCIIFIDDDLELQKDFVEYMYQVWKENPDDIQGWFTRIFTTSYWDSIPYNKADTEVDYVGTGGLVMSRDLFDNHPELLDPPEEMIRVEDLWLSYVARENGVKLYACERHCKIINDGKDQYQDLIEYKERAFNYLLKKGWQLKS